VAQREKTKLQPEPFLVKDVIELEQHRTAMFIQLGLFWLFLVVFLLSATLLTLAEVEVIKPVKYHWEWVLGVSGVGLLAKGILQAIKR
jgi:hypothetical protein